MSAERFAIAARTRRDLVIVGVLALLGAGWLPAFLFVTKGVGGVISIVLVSAVLAAAAGHLLLLALRPDRVAVVLGDEERLVRRLPLAPAPLPRALGAPHRRGDPGSEDPWRRSVSRPSDRRPSATPWHRIRR